MSLNIHDNASFLEHLMRSPRLAIWRREIDTALDKEQHKRQHFYDVITEHQKAEFINGEIIVHSPAKLEHVKSLGSLFKLLSTFVEQRGLGLVGQEKMLITLSRNDYESDICYFPAAKASLFSDKQMKFPAPDLAVEILSPSTAHVDRETKFEDYAAHGVREYWIIDPDTQTFEQYQLVEDRYELVIKARSGNVNSLVVTGFEIPIRAIFDKDENLSALRRILG